MEKSEQTGAVSNREQRSPDLSVKVDVVTPPPGTGWEIVTALLMYLSAFCAYACSYAGLWKGFYHPQLHQSGSLLGMLNGIFLPWPWSSPSVPQLFGS